MRNLARYATSLGTMIGAAAIAATSYIADVQGFLTDAEGNGPPWDWVFLAGLVVFIGLVVLRDVRREKAYVAHEAAALDERNQNACLKVLDVATTTISRARESIEGSSVWDQQRRIAGQTGIRIRSLMEDLSNLGRPSVALIVAYEFQPTVNSGATPEQDILRWLDRMQEAVDRARDDVWKGRR